MDKYILDWLHRRLPQDKIWMDTFEDRLRKLEKMKLVKKKGNIWTLTELGTMCASIQNLPYTVE